MKRIFTVVAMVSALALVSACGEPFDPFAFMNPDFDEGLNLHDITGTVRVPAEFTNHVGAIYIGLYSGVDDTGGYPLPVTAPGTQDAFPYGGTSIGTYESRDTSTGLRDPALGCSVVNNREFYPAGDGSDDLLHDFLIRQFPFYPGTTVWAFADNDNTSCDEDGGVTDPGTDLESTADDVVYPSNFSNVLNFPQDYADAQEPFSTLPADLITDQGGIVLQELQFIEITLDCKIDDVTGC